MAILRFILLAVPFLAWWGYVWLKRARFEQFKSLPRLPPSLIWGHMKALNEYIQAAGAGKHTGKLHSLPVYNRPQHHVLTRLFDYRLRIPRGMASSRPTSSRTV